MPKRLIEKLLDENISLGQKLSFEEINFPKLNNVLDKIKGLNIIAGLQKMTKKDCLTVFRAVRFPTYKRMYEVLYKHGYSILNYEQERILEFYQDKIYLQKRKEIKNDPRFWTQPQERVVKGLPLFCLINDALQIHRAFRGKDDKVGIIAIYIPYKLLKNKKIKLIANAAIDLDYNNNDRDFEIIDFIKNGNSYQIDYDALFAKGIDLNEMYSRELPLNFKQMEKAKISFDFFLLNIYKVADSPKINGLFNNTKVLKNNKYFLHGFFGDQNIFGRGKTKYLPHRCQKILKK